MNENNIFLQNMLKNIANVTKKSPYLPLQQAAVPQTQAVANSWLGNIPAGSMATKNSSILTPLLVLLEDMIWPKAAGETQQELLDAQRQIAAGENKGYQLAYEYQDGDALPPVNQLGWRY